MQDHQTQSSSDEIDLGVVFEKIKSFFKSILIGIVQIFQFFWNHKFMLLGLLVVGLGIRYYLKSTTDSTYANQFLIRTNYKSTEYVYSKVSSINSKIETQDTIFLKEIFGKDYKRIRKVEVNPVIDVYGLVNESEENKEAFELLLDEFGDFAFLEEDININEYPTHKLNIYIKGKKGNKSLATNLYNYLADNPFFIELKNSALENLKEQLRENKIIRSQIDEIIEEHKGDLSFSSTDNNSINFSGSQNLLGLLNQKRILLRDDLAIKSQLSSEDDVLKIVDSSFEVFDKKSTPSYLVFPFAFVGLYCLIFFFKFLRRNTQKFLKE